MSDCGAQDKIRRTTMTWTVITAVLTCLIYGPALRRRWKHQSSRTRTLHFSNGVCEENEDGVWRRLRYLGLRRELGKTLRPEGHNRVLTAERGAYRPPRVDVYYWVNYPIWGRPYPQWSQGGPGEYSFRYAVIALILAVVAMTC